MTTDGEEDALNQLLGMTAYATICAQARLAKDADQAPKAFEHVAMARMSGAAWHTFERLEKRAEVENIDLIRALERYEGILDDFDARTRPTTWWERLTKTYVGVGIFTDAMRHIALGAGEEQMAAEVNDFGHGQWVRERLEPYTAADEQLRARLSLWTRRVGGEALGLVRAFIFTNPELVGKLAADTVMEEVSRAHRERLKAVHLDA